MSFDATLGFTDSTATVHLSGRLDDRGTSALRGLLEQAGTRPIRRLRLEMAGLESLGSAGARCLALAQQQLPPGTEMTVEGASGPVRAALRAAGLSGTVVSIEDSVSLPDIAEAA
ncbi:STAS domain-containing protein [Streptomyces hoynatensis]|uniref:Anti-sigma factor antagonist n=1 Tax=Streptomyces hoynatensis TaxID=1141874 RepID=A0A3A9YHX5_9ACTN|nr:STAS domain-containing protein [Streptomyces hoynatensis]RKN36698.1 anti-sigma factor antagonist [Streptomyces hoynatensis]